MSENQDKVLRDKIVEYVRESSAKKHVSPSIRDIVRKMHTNNKKIYEIFPGKIKEIYALAGTDIDQDRLDRIRPAQVARSEESASAKQIEIQNPIELAIDTFEKFKKTTDESEERAKLDNADAAIFTKIFLPKVDGNLWWKINVLAGKPRNVESLIKESLGQTTYRELEEECYIRRTKPPTLRSWISEKLTSWIKERASKGLCVPPLPVIAKDECYYCRSPGLGYIYTWNTNFFSSHYRPYCPNCTALMPEGHCPMCLRGEFYFHPPRWNLCSAHCGYQDNYPKPLPMCGSDPFPN